MTAPGSQPGVSIFEGKAMTTTIDEEKSQARAVLGDRGPLMKEKQI